MRFGMGIFLIMLGFVLLLAALTTAIGGYGWLGITDGWNLMLFGVIAVVFGAAAIGLQFKLTPG